MPPKPKPRPSPADRFRSKIQLFTTLWSTLGCNMLDPDFHLSIRTASLFALIVIFNVACLYTMYRSELQVAINSAAYIGIALQGPPKLYSAIRHFAVFRRLVEIQLNTFRRIARCGSAQLQRQTERFGRLFSTVFLIPYTIIVIVALVVLSGPLIFYLVFGRAYVPMLENCLPFVDNRQMPGYAVTFVFHALCVGIVINGNSTSDGYFLMMVMHSYVLYASFRSSVEHLNRRLGQKGVRLRKARQLLRSTLQMHQEYYEYTKLLTELYYPIATCDLYTNALSMCGIIYCIQMLDDSVQAVFLIVLMFAKLLLLCVQGTVLDICNDSVLDAVLSLCWYQLPTVPMQKTYILLVRAAQNPRQIMVDVKPLNMAVFVSVMKTVYTIVMLLMD